MSGRSYVAVDLGAGSGRVTVGRVTDDRVTLDVTHRFPNAPLFAAGHERWPVGRLLQEVRTGLAKAAQAGGELVSVGVDTWGVDFGLTDAAGRVLEDPVSYRDRRTEGVVDRVLDVIPRAELFRVTGLQILPLNTLFQLVAQRASGEWPASAARLLMMPDLVHHDLCGSLVGELTMASTTQLASATTRRWAPELFDRLDLPIDLMPELVQPGTRLGRIRRDLRETAGLPQMEVVAPATHDTASAVVGAPLEPGWAYLSSGTWSLLGVETEAPVLTDAVQAQNLTNEGGVEGTNRLLKNIAGLWLLESCRKAWAAQGYSLGLDALEAALVTAPARRAFVLPDHPRFFNPPDMPGAIAAFLRESGQPVPDEPAGFARVILESPALRYASVLDRIEHAAARPVRGVRIIGGGAQNRFLNHATADATGREVRTGPVEATALGNVIVQAIADGRFANVSEARALVAREATDGVYTPGEPEAWAEARGRFERLAREWGADVQPRAESPEPRAESLRIVAPADRVERPVLTDQRQVGLLAEQRFGHRVAPDGILPRGQRRSLVARPEVQPPPEEVSFTGVRVLGIRCQERVELVAGLRGITAPVGHPHALDVGFRPGRRRGQRRVGLRPPGLQSIGARARHRAPR